MKAYERDPDKMPAAVVLLTRGPLVLALTRGHARLDNLHLPGGKEKDEDHEGIGVGLAHYYTAIRELTEETGVVVGVENLRPLAEYVAHTGRPVRAFLAKPQPGGRWPTTFESTEAGMPGWADPRALLAPWCTYREECGVVLKAATATNEALALVLAHVDWARI